MKLNPIKIVHITEAWKGGIETYVQTLINFQLKSKEFKEVHLLCSKNRTYKLPNIKNLVLHQYQSSRNPFKLLKVINQINQIIKEINPDIIHLHSSFPGVYGRIIKLRKSDNSLIHIVYCPHGWSFNQDLGFIKKQIYILIERFLSKYTSAIISTSKHEYQSALKNNILAQCNSAILSCVRDVNYTKSTPIQTSKDKINLGFIGRFDKQKGFDFLCEQMKFCNRQDVQIYIIGDVERDKKNNFSKNKDFIYLGWIDYQKIDDYLKQFDALIIPSRWEGQGLITLDSMRNSKAIIVSDKGPLPETVIQGYNGYIFPLEEPEIFRNIIDNLDKKELVRMGKNSRTIYEQCFSGDRQNIEILKLYKQILSEDQ